jgi:hypothetical protein
LALAIPIGKQNQHLGKTDIEISRGISMSVNVIEDR